MFIFIILGLGGVYAFDKDIFQKVWSNINKGTDKKINIQNTGLKDSLSLEINNFEGLKKAMESGISYKCSSESSYKDEKGLQKSSGS